MPCHQASGLNLSPEVTGEPPAFLTAPTGGVRGGGGDEGGTGGGTAGGIGGGENSGDLSAQLDTKCGGGPMSKLSVHTRSEKESPPK